MANYNINSGNLTALGTSDADNFYFRTGGGPNVVINAAAGNDSTYIQDSQSAIASSLDNLFLSLQGGADYLLASGDSRLVGDATAGTIRAGAGGDSLTLNLPSASLANYSISLGDGSDSLAANLIGITDSAITAGSGADTVVISAATITDSEILLGSGNDSLSVSASTVQSAEFTLGGGADFGNFDIATVSSSSIDGGDGNDTIIVSSTTFSTSIITAGGGDDSITFSAGSTVKSTFNAGSGNDTISFVSTAVTLNTSTQVLAGSGNDSIYFSGTTVNTGMLVKGGAGLDTINIANIAAGNANAVYIAYDAPSESNYTSYDRIIASANQTAVVQTTNLALASTSNGTYSWGYISNGVAFFTSGSPTLEQAIDYLDDVLNVGQAVGFSAQGTDPYNGNLNNNSFLFIQGGGQNGDSTADYVIQAGTSSSAAGAGQVGATRVDTTTNTLNVKFN